MRASAPPFFRPRICFFKPKARKWKSIKSSQQHSFSYYIPSQSLNYQTLKEQSGQILSGTSISLSKEEFVCFLQYMSKNFWQVWSIHLWLKRRPGEGYEKNVEYRNKKKQPKDRKNLAKVRNDSLSGRLPLRQFKQSKVRQQWTLFFLVLKNEFRKTLWCRFGSGGKV